MRPELRRLFRIVQCLGLSPFYIEDGGLRFSWCSFQVFYFTLVTVIGILYECFEIYGCMTIWRASGLASALTSVPWIFAAAHHPISSFLLIIKRNGIVSYVNQSASIWTDDPRHCINRRSIKRERWVFLINFIVPCIVLTWSLVSRPYWEVYPSTLLCTKDETCPVAYVVIGSVIQIAWMFLLWGTYMTLEVIPVELLLGYNKALEVVEEDIAKLASNPLEVSTEKMPKEDVPTKNSVAALNDLTENSNAKLSKAQQLRDLMIRHMHYQNGVHCFGDTFAPFIMASILLVFTLCLPLFYAVIKTGMSNVVDLAVFLGNGIQILIRGVCVLYAYGTPYETAQSTKRRIQLDMHVIDHLAQYDSQIISAGNFFITTLDNLYVTVGSYFCCTRNIIITLFGALATYVVVLIQSV